MEDKATAIYKCFKKKKRPRNGGDDDDDGEASNLY